MFIDDKEPINVKVWYRKIGNSYVALSDRGFKEAKIDEKNRAKYKTLNVQMKPLTWEMYNDLQDRSYISEINSDKRKFNYRIFKESKLKNLIVSWDAQTTNEKGESIPIPVNHANIMKLAPDIAEAIIEGYDQLSLITEEEEGNL